MEVLQLLMTIICYNKAKKFFGFFYNFLIADKP